MLKNKINLRFFIFFVCLILNAAVLASDKRGVGLANLQGGDRIDALNVAWYYTWNPEPIAGVSAEKFVPMIWGGHKLEKQITFLKSQKKSSVLLVINEPNKRKQANMSVHKVIEIWPRLQGLTEAISSPAPAGPLNSWFNKFNKQAKKNNITFDFMAVHIYSSADPVKFLAKVDAIYKKYNRPIWITEFAVADWEAAGKQGKNKYTEAEVLAFMQAVLPELEARDFVKRYAWFGAGNYSLKREQVRTSRLFEKDGELTPLGKFYANFQ